MTKQKEKTNMQDVQKNTIFFFFQKKRSQEVPGSPGTRGPRFRDLETLKVPGPKSPGTMETIVLMSNLYTVALGAASLLHLLLHPFV